MPALGMKPRLVIMYEDWYIIGYLIGIQYIIAMQPNILCWYMVS